MTRRLFLAMLGLAVIAVVLYSAVAPDDALTAARRGVLIGLERDGFALALQSQDTLESELNGAARHAIQTLADRAATPAHAIAAVADRTGSIVVVAPGAPSDALRSVLVHEARRAMRRGAVESVTRSAGGESFEIVAVPVSANRGIVGVVVLADRSTVISDVSEDRFRFVTPVFAATIGVSALIALILARALARPIEQLRDAAQRVARDGAGAPEVEVRGPPEIRQLQDAFNGMSVRVRRLLDRQSHFASDVAHQLRTPLTTLGVSLDRMTLRIAESDASDAAEGLTIARDEVVRLHRFIEGLLVLTRAPLAESVRVPIDIVTVARERVVAWSDLARERGVELGAEMPDHAGALAVEGAVDQILDNLIDNALDAAPSGSSIEISVAQRDGVVAVSVRDQGPGLSETDRENAFERFWRGGSATSSGIGIGLTIVRDLAEASHGEVELLDADGGGTEAVLRLEASLLAAARSGERWAVAELYHDVHPRLARYLRARAPQSADEVEREVWLATAGRLFAHGDQVGFRASVFSIARQRLRDRGRIRKGRQDGVGFPEDAAEFVVRSLSRAQSELLLLRVVAGLEVTEVAQVIGKPTRTVIRLEHRAVRRLERRVRKCRNRTRSE